jgi:hypothetical protein
MVHKAYFLLFTLFIIVGCSDLDLSSKSQTLTQTDLAICVEVACPEVSVEYQTYAANNVLESDINKEIQAYIIQALYLGDPAQLSTPTNIREAATHFIESYWKAHAEFPDLAAEYYAEISITETFRNEHILSLEASQYTYTGGAHGNGTLRYLNFDIETGKKIGNETLFTNTKAMTQLAEAQFRKAYGIAKDSDINSDRFWFDDATFYLPESIGFVKDSVVFHYNPYEIASYADGPIDVVISLKEAGPFLNF